jgi:hypothetical protein
VSSIRENEKESKKRRNKARTNEQKEKGMWKQSSE